MTLKTGRVAETFALPPLISLNTPHALKFHYQSTTAVPQAVLRQEYPHFYNTVVNHDVVTFLPKSQKLRISVGAEFREFAYAPVDKIVSEHHFLWNAKNAQGQTVSTGSYPYDARLRSVFDGFLADSVTPSGVDVILEKGVRGLVRINNKEQGPFGAGWSLEDLWEVHPNPDGSALVVQGDGHTTHFAKGYGLGLLAGKLDQAGFSGDCPTLQKTCA